jgi:hypothetical protein
MTNAVLLTLYHHSIEAAVAATAAVLIMAVRSLVVWAVSTSR